ncbi:hypothetical protein LTR12_018204, partial [Friedmanniomyces endolithicus]
MNNDDWDGLQANDCMWQPNEKAHFAVLEEDDVLIMPLGLRMVHAVSTLESSYCEGGMFWNDQNIIQLLDALYWNCRHQNATNEPFPFQMRDFIEQLTVIVDDNPESFAAGKPLGVFQREFEAAIGRIGTLGCD